MGKRAIKRIKVGEKYHYSFSLGINVIEGICRILEITDMEDCDEQMVKVYDLERKSTFVKCKSSIRFTKCEE
jgi:hypothetical protein